MIRAVANWYTNESAPDVTTFVTWGMRSAPIWRRRHRETPNALLTNILDPNRTVDPAFLQYLIIDKSGRTFSGKIVAETATSITLTSGKGVQDTVLRTNIDEIISSGKSLMPEGFEKTISKEEMADLIAFLNGLESTPGTKQTPPVGGTRPGTVEP